MSGVPPSEPDAHRRCRVLTIIVNYKSADFALDCIRALRSEVADPALELRAVVVENASGDAEALRRGLEGESWVSLLVADKNGGFAYGNNRGFSFGFESGFRPDYFHLLNPDTRIEPGAVAELVRFMAAHPRAGIAGSNLINGDGSEWSTAFRFPTLASEIDRALRVGVVTSLLARWVVPRRMGDHPERVDWVAGASFMVRREVIEQLGGLDEEYFLYFEETDFCFKVRSGGWECWYVPDSRVVHYAGHSTGIRSDDLEPTRYPAYWFESRRRFFAKNYGVTYAGLTDAAFAAGWALGRVKRTFQGRLREDPPRFLRDLLVKSPLVSPANRIVSEERCFTTAAERSSGDRQGSHAKG